jgi:Type III restriction enzyme, res subunit
MARITPEDIRKKGKVPKNASLFFTIFHTFMSGAPKDGKPSPYFGEYPADFFDFIVIDECHRGGANDESNWRESWSTSPSQCSSAWLYRDPVMDSSRYPVQMTGPLVF